MKGRTAPQYVFGNDMEDYVPPAGSLTPPALFEGRHVDEETFTRFRPRIRWTTPSR
jgi:hypothetical protein